MSEVADVVVEEETGQTALLDLTGKEFNAMWVDEKQALFIPNNPLHFKTHKLQVLLDRLDKQASKNPAQFNSTTYLNVLNEYTKCAKAINEGEQDVLDTPAMDSERAGRKEAAAMGSGAASSLDLGVSADNPLAGQGPSTT